LMGHMRSTMDALRSGVFVDGIEVNWIWRIVRSPHSHAWSLHTMSSYHWLPS
jgi:hypothetical protein